LNDSGIKRLLDVRLNNASRLAGFARRADLPFFLEKLCSAEYIHEPELAPTREILDAYRNGGAWPDYERAFLDLLQERRVEETLDKNLFEIPTVLLCSEARAVQCHRRLVLEYLGREWGGIRAVHL
jgi:primosomal protein N''